MDTYDEQAFNEFVSRLSENISKGEIDTLKQFIAAHYQLDVQCLGTFEQLVQELGEKLKLSQMELLLETLYVLKRKDLVKLALECRSTLNPKSNFEHEDTDNEPVTVRIEHLSFSEDHVREIKLKLSDLLFVPVNKIKVKCKQELNSGGFICIYDIPGIFVDLLQEMLESDDKVTGLNYFGITDVHLRNVAYKVKDKMIPEEMLHQHKKIIAILKDQNDDFIQRLDKLSASLDTLLPLVAELGDPKTHVKNLSNLHKHSGMSTTIWKVLGKFSDDQLPEKYKPDFSQEEIRKQSLYSKARMQRLYPQLTMSLKQEK